MSHSGLRHCRLSHSGLRHCRLSHSGLSHCRLRHAWLTHHRLTHYWLTHWVSHVVEHGEGRIERHVLVAEQTHSVGRRHPSSVVASVHESVRRSRRRDKPGRRRSERRHRSHRSHRHQRRRTRNSLRVHQIHERLIRVHGSRHVRRHGSARHARRLRVPTLVHPDRVRTEARKVDVQQILHHVTLLLGVLRFHLRARGDPQVLDVLLLQKSHPHTRRRLQRGPLRLLEPVLPETTRPQVSNLSDSHHPLRFQNLGVHAVDLADVRLPLSLSPHAYTQLLVELLTDRTQKHAEIHTEVLHGNPSALHAHLVVLDAHHLLQRRVEILLRTRVRQVPDQGNDHAPIGYLVHRAEEMDILLGVGVLAVLVVHVRLRQ